MRLLLFSAAALVTTSFAAPTLHTFDDAIQNSVLIRSPLVDAPTTPTAVDLVQRDRPVFKLYMNGPKVHAGQLQSDALFKAVTDAFDFLCPKYRSGDTCRHNICWKIAKDIEFDDGSDNINTRSYLVLCVRGSWLTPEDVGMREEFVQQIAGSLKVITEDGRNCHIELKYSSVPYWCNIPTKIRVDLLNWRSPSGFIEAEFLWRENGVQAGREWGQGGCFDCVSSVGDSRRYLVNEGVIYAIASIIGGENMLLPSSDFGCGRTELSCLE
ncbi:hypothetical protein EJ04DRAFT_570323 [Polyplosphaeria fusca]|uniref:Uncharacterized protein n=1 Tax=Polyplosphaeria fusca TaxID=682080 RepID=A0A9P4UW44_9PLEO|nr:hypothetical protein EJ04DRAFT_570323 [Polyplosphaeria fusca]